MEAVHTREPPEGETHLTFETAAEHATARVPVAGPRQRVGDSENSWLDSVMKARATLSCVRLTSSSAL